MKLQKLLGMNHALEIAEGESLDITGPMGLVQIEHTSDTFSITKDDRVFFSAERNGEKWIETWPSHEESE